MLLILALFPALAWAQVADMVVSNARIYTGRTAQKQASAMAIRNGRILAVAEDVSQYTGPKTRRINARGATVLPGFIDSHGHMAALGESFETLDFRSARSVEDILRLVRKTASELPPGDWIRGRNWDQTRWRNQAFPTAEELSKAAPSHPVYLTRVDGHAAWVNDQAMERADITASTPDPPGGKILRNASGAPTGLLIDGAQQLVRQIIPAPTDQQIQRYLARAAAQCARVGLTTVHDAGVSERELAAYRVLIKQNKLPIRIYAMIGDTGSLWKHYQDRGPEIGDRLTIRSIKLMADGAMGSRGAAFWAPYSDDPGNSGLLLLTGQQLQRVAREAMRAGFQVSTHAIGDRANRVVLDAYGAVLSGKNDRRFRIEHAQVVALEDMPLFQKYSVIASMQATHAVSDMRWAEARLGPQRILGAYAWRRLLALGVPIANGSDFPVEEPNPLLGFYAAITRQDRAGNPDGGWRAGQRMTREEALESWTRAGAYAAFEEENKGTLAPGKLADFVVLSADIMKIPPRDILSTRVTMTVLGGKIVYSEPK